MTWDPIRVLRFLQGMLYVVIFRCLAPTHNFFPSHSSQDFKTPAKKTFSLSVSHLQNSTADICKGVTSLETQVYSLWIPQHGPCDFKPTCSCVGLMEKGSNWEASSCTPHFQTNVDLQVQTFFWNQFANIHALVAEEPKQFYCEEVPCLVQLESCLRHIWFDDTSLKEDKWRTEYTSTVAPIIVTTANEEHSTKSTKIISPSYRTICSSFRYLMYGKCKLGAASSLLS